MYIDHGETCAGNCGLRNMQHALGLEVCKCKRSPRCFSAVCDERSNSCQLRCGEGYYEISQDIATTEGAHEASVFNSTGTHSDYNGKAWDKILRIKAGV